MSPWLLSVACLRDTVVSFGKATVFVASRPIVVVGETAKTDPAYVPTAPTRRGDEADAVVTAAPDTVEHAQLPAASLGWPQNWQAEGSATMGGGGALGFHAGATPSSGGDAATSIPAFLSVAAIPPD